MNVDLSRGAVTVESFWVTPHTYSEWFVDFEMSTFLSNLPGPFFDFLLTNGDHWERSGKAQRIKGIKHEYFHHPDALRVQDVIISQVANCFRKAHPDFNYYGPTEFRNENLDELINYLGEWIIRCRSCGTKEDFNSLLEPYFRETLTSVTKNLDEHWSNVRDDLAAKIAEVRDRARLAQRERKALLVLGI